VNPQRIGAAVCSRPAPAKADRDGGFSTLEAVIVIPLVVILTMITVQFVLMWHARNIAEAAARNGLRVARGYQATGAGGQLAACEYLDTVAGHLLTRRSCTASRTSSGVIITVQATVMSVVPFGKFGVTETSTGPVETFRGNG